MMAEIYRDNDADLGLIEDKTIAVIGYGSQGHAHALNLMDSGLNVSVGLRKGSKSWARAKQAGLRVDIVSSVVADADIIVMLTPDQVQRQIYYDSVEPFLADGNMLMFAHGFNIHFRQIVPPPIVDVTMVAPKAPGHRMREIYREGMGVPALLAVSQNATGLAKGLALAYAPSQAPPY